MKSLKPFGPSIGLEKLSQAECDHLMATCDPSLPNANKVLVQLVENHPRSEYVTNAKELIK